MSAILLRAALGFTALLFLQEIRIAAHALGGGGALRRRGRGTVAIGIFIALRVFALGAVLAAACR